MSIAKNIKELRISHKLSQLEFGKIAGVSDKAVSTWESGKKIPRMGAIQRLADHFGISKSDIIEDTSPKIESNIAAVIDSNNIYSIPVFESVSAGFGAYASDEILNYIPVVIKNPYDVEDTIAIKVTGNSMYPKIEDGDIIVVRKQDSVDNGDIAVVLIGDEGLVKKIEYGRNWIDLISINPVYEPRRLTDEEAQELRVVGKVLQIVKLL